MTSLSREAFGFICRDQATTGFLGYIFKFVLIQRIAMIASLHPGLHLQVLKLRGGGGHHDVPEGLLYGGAWGDQVVWTSLARVFVNILIATRRESLVNDRVDQCEDCPMVCSWKNYVYFYIFVFFFCIFYSTFPRYGSTACALNWKASCQPKLKACYSRGLRGSSR